MRLTKTNLYLIKLPLKKVFKHGSFERSFNETVILEMRDESNIGYGEALPREYVTGEKIGGIVERLSKYISRIPKEIKSLKHISDFLYECEPGNSRNMALLCALDMALVDLYAKSKESSVSDLICDELEYNRTHEPRITSGPIGLNTPGWKKSLYYLAGLKDIKLKINPETPPSRINNIGKNTKSFRVDGNCSLTPGQLEEMLKDVKVAIHYIEQPFLVGVERNINGVRFMADESLVSMDDAKTINFDAASVRIGKNGGILRTLDIIKVWADRGKPYMLGSLVGETSLLSSALLHIASITNPFLIEGCYSTRVLKTDPTDVHPSISCGGKVNFDYSKPGLGVNLDTTCISSEKIEIRNI